MTRPPSVCASLYPSIPAAYKHGSGIPPVPSAKASALWHVDAIVVSDKASLSVEKPNWTAATARVMWGCRATTKTAELTAWQQDRKQTCVRLLAATPKFSVHDVLFTRQIFFLWGLQIRSATEVRRNLQAMCFPEHTSAPVNPGSVSDICAHLALFLSPLQWIFLKADWFKAEKRIPLASE